MSLFDLQDVCIAIGSLATLDLPMVVDLIGIYVLKGPYCTLTTTNWFLQALSVIPRGSWGDVARRFTMIRWEEDFGECDFLKVNRGQIAISQDEGQNCHFGLVHIDGGILIPVVDLIRRIYRRLQFKIQFPCDSGWSQAPRRQQDFTFSHETCAIPSEMIQRARLTSFARDLSLVSAKFFHLIHLTAAQLSMTSRNLKSSILLSSAKLLMTSRDLKSSIHLDDVTTSEIFNKPE
ncbi:putative sucrose-phosphate synthase 1-like [Dorcoceras hygrometricum]|uniref:Putative sucrose-phosphate synthase 1-like n=1 Tax=Dorcoceras hygrometricum TaxID=472368 RepID=A0A2Z7A8Z2_9LAMI|nr:putative sucrose-phosphate synthase 1-like [Dorcoceras hygrometricum]